MHTPADRNRLLELRQSFHFNDLNHDGRIDFAEFRALLESLEAGIDEEGARIGFEEIDTDEDGAIGLQEFVAWWVSD